MIRLKAPAKINLSLRVLGRRSDGYHEVDSLMQMVSLYDEIEIHPHPRAIEIRTSGASLSDGPGNLAYDAAVALGKASGIDRGAIIELTKHIPIGAGLGGGSSDAATVLAGLNRHWRLGWPRRRLAELGATLGSDVPFFFSGPTARVGGRGERVERIARTHLQSDLLQGQWAVLINPGIAVSTRWAFEALGAPLLDQSLYSTTGLTKPGSADRIPRFPGAPAPSCPVENSLESVTAMKYPVILEMKRTLQDAGASVVSMSGSGPTVFGLFPARAPAAAALKAVPSIWKGWIVRLLCRAPW
ncbi:MAG: 4-(cytidine 5'-diphospho)-2-C-methyl-D-erythritol kinase [Nitrospiria bacterium]